MEKSRGEQVKGKKEEDGETRSGLLTEQQIIATYRGMLGEVSQMRRKIAELEQELSEHQLVVDTLTPLEASRRAYRLVGGVLVERTVGEVLPSVKTNQEGIKQLLQQLAKSQADKELAATKWKLKYNIRSQQEAQAQQQAREQAKDENARQNSRT